MENIELENLWARAIQELLGSKIDDIALSVLARQTSDSIRRVEVYKSYKKRALHAVKFNIDYFQTYIPFVLAQRDDLNEINKLWILYLATYFGKSNKSHWTLFKRAAFDNAKSIISFEYIQNDMGSYFEHLNGINFFDGCSYSNHRKFTAKRLMGEKGVFQSMEYFVNNIDLYSIVNKIDFDSMYGLAQKIPNFGRLAAFDFSSSLVKCGLNVEEPKSMYAEYSTGPLEALELLLKITKNDSSSKSKIKLASDLMNWFTENTNIFMAGQILEDAICNWQKNISTYVKYSG